MTAQERLEWKCIPEPNSGCWLWLGAVSSSGYGTFYFNGRLILAHRASWAIYTGRDISDASVKICHTCDNMICVNPEHLWEGSQKQNVLDCWSKGRAGPRGLLGGRIGGRNSQAVFTDEQIFMILDDLAIGGRGKARALAREFGVAETTISAIKRGQNWGHILQKWKEKRL